MKDLTLFQGFGITDGKDQYATRLQVEKLYDVPRKTLADNINALKEDGLISGARIRHTATDGQRADQVHYRLYQPHRGHCRKAKQHGALSATQNLYQHIRQKVQLGKGKYIPTTGRKGTSDISGVFEGVPLAVEVKIGKDKMSKAQEEYKAQFEAAGGWFCIARDFGQFYNEFSKQFMDGN